MNEEIKLDLGNVKVHKNVLEGIIAKTIEGMEGVSLIEPTLSDRIKVVLRGPFKPGVKIIVDENNDINIGVSVNIHFGTNIQEMASKLQELIKNDIKKSLDINIKDINIDIEGIERG